MNKLNQIIFIDDDEAINFYHELIVKKSEVCNEYEFFSDAESALNYFGKLNQNDEVADLIFLDINMPKIDGWEFLNKYEKLELKKSPIIIILTTSLSERDLNKAKENKLVYSLVNKPLTLDQLQKLVTEIRTN